MGARSSNHLILASTIMLSALASGDVIACALYSQECFSSRFIAAEGREYRWQPMLDSFGTIDLNQDGIPDHVFVGRPNVDEDKGKKIRVGVVLGWKDDRSRPRSELDGEQIHTSSFDLVLESSDRQDGLCDSRVSLKALSIAPDAKELSGNEPDGYPQHAENSVFEITAGECDPIYAYWNFKLKRLMWLRA